MATGSARCARSGAADGDLPAVSLLYLLLAAAAGAMLPVQAGVNAQLARFVGGPVRASFVSFLVGTIALLALSVAILKPLPSGSKLGTAPWWVWVGGLLGAFYVVGVIVSAPRRPRAPLRGRRARPHLLAPPTRVRCRFSFRPGGYTTKVFLLQSAKRLKGDQ